MPLDSNPPDSDSSEEAAVLLRRLSPLAASLLAASCAPSVPGPESTQPSAVDIAVFDPANSKIPQPNDLDFQQLSALPQGAAKDLLGLFYAQGGFPSDQDTPIAIDLQHQALPTSAGPGTNSAPDLDPTKVIACPAANCNVAVFEQTSPSTQPALVPVDASYLAGTDHGTLYLRAKKHPLATNPSVQTGRWTPGAKYIAAVRGPNGLATKSGAFLNPSATFFLLTRDLDLTQPQNQTLLPGTPDQKAAAGAQLEKLRQSYLPAFGLVDAAFPHRDLAVLTTFRIAPARPTVYVEFDQAAGSVPLPSDFLLDSTGHISAAAAQAFGPLASGMRTLDGFSTTALIAAQTSGAVDIASLAGNVYLYKLDLVAKTAALVADATAGAGATYVLEPPQLGGSCGPANPSTSTACIIGLQPAVPISASAALPPLEENTEYAVLITDGVKDSAKAAGISRNTITTILTFTNPLADAAGKSLLPGVDDASAAGLELMRQVLQIPIGTLAATGVAPSRVAAAYTFRTQTVTGKNSFNASLALKPNTDPGALGLAALPYQVQAASPSAFTPLAISLPLTPTAAFHKYGIEIDGAVGSFQPVPTAAIDSVFEVQIPLLSYLSNATGAFDPTLLASGQGATTVVTALVSVPLKANVPTACPGALGLPAGTQCAPLVVFHHGLGSTKAAMLTVANELNAQGFVVAAIDAPLHGDRASCAKDSECAGGAAGSCVPNAALVGQGDAKAPGTCTGGLAHVPQLCATTACTTAWGAAGGNNGQTLASAEYFVSGNFFRTRDVNRQDVIDNSGLILALSPASAGPPNKFQQALLAKGIFVAPPSPSSGLSNVFWEGQSYGSIVGTLNAAANPRLAKAVLNVGGGTQVDVFSTKGSTFRPRLEALLSSLGVVFDPVTHDPTPATAGLYLKFINIAKWILDPSDPINFARYVTTDGTKTLPNLLLKQANQAGKAALGQIAECDATVPNPTNAELYLNMGLGPLYTGANPSTSSTVTTFIELSNAGPSCVGTAAASTGTLAHGFLTSWGISYDATNTPIYDATVNTLTKDAQDQAAAFLSAGTLPANSDAK